MDKVTKVMLWAIAILFVAGMVVQVVSANEVPNLPSNKFAKIYMDPLYRQSMDQDTNYTYTLNVDTPDGISSVQSAMLTMQVWHNPTVNYYVWVDGQTCNTVSFQVHTSFANAGEGTIFFDCSNIITHEGEYNVTFQTDDDIGASTFWADITYQDNPKGNFQFFGTEYRPGERGRVFLQLKDNQGLPEDNGDCAVNIWYPWRANSTNDPYVVDAPMLHDADGNGLYFYDIAQLPEEVGIYMMTAGCNAQVSSAFVYETDGTDSNYPTRTAITGTYSSSEIVLNGYTDFLYTKCASGGGGTKTCQATYDFDLSDNSLNSSNVTDLSLFYMGEASTNALLVFEAYNYSSSSWYTLPNSLTYSGLAVAGSPTGLNDFQSNHIPDTDFISGAGIIQVRLTATSVTIFQEYDNWLNINLRTATGIVQELKGSGEIHVNDWFDYYRQSYTDSNWENFTNGTIAQNVVDQLSEGAANATWNFENRTITDTQQLWTGQTEYSTTEATGKVVVRATDRTGDPLVGATCNVFIAYPNNTLYLNQTMTETTGGLFDGVYYVDFNHSGEIGVHPYAVDCDKFGQDYFFMNTYHVFNALNETELVQDVWNYTNRTLTEAPVNVTQIADAVWNYTGTINTNLLDQIATAIWNYTNRQLTAFSFPFSVNSTEIANAVWASPTRLLTGFNFNVTLTPATIADIWTYTTRSLTEFDFVVNTTVDYAAISDYVWNNTQRELTFYDHETGASYVWNATTRELTNAPFDPSAIAANVWNYTNRSLSEFDFTVQTVMTPLEIATYVWNNTQRDLTFYDHSTGAEYVWNATTRELTTSPFDPAAIANATWNYADRQLTQFTFTVNTTVDYASISDYVWNNTNRQLTFYDHETAALYNWNATTRELTAAPFDPSLIANATWNYANRSLTEFGFTVEATVNTTAISDAVWTASNRDLTFYDHETAALYNWNSTTRELTTSPFDPAAIANATWNYADRQLTDFSFVVNTTVDYASISDYVWNNTQRELTFFDYETNALYTWNSTTRELTSAPFDPSGIAANVWNYTNRSLSEFGFTVDATVNTTAISDAVWTASNRDLTFYDHETAALYNWNSTTRELTTSPFDPAAIANATWNYADRQLTTFSFTVNTTVDYGAISDYVWNNTQRELTFVDWETGALYNWNTTTRELTAAPFDPSSIASNVWNYTNRSLTEFGFTVDALVNETAIANAVWSSPTRDLTFYDHETGALYNWNSTTRELTNSPFDPAAIANATWTYSDRQLTSFGFEVAVNETAIANEVWSSPTRDLTFYDHETAALYNWNSTTRELTTSPFDPAAIANATWNYNNRSLTEFGFTVDATVNTTAISDAVWSAPTRDLTFYDHETAALYTWNSTTRELTTSPFDPAAIANATWNYADRELTNFTFVVGATVDWETGADYVWNATNRTLTTAPFDPAVISQAVWTFASRNLTFTEDVFNYTALNNNQGDLLSAIASVDNNVWNYSNRTLTEAPFDPNLIATAVWAFTNRNLTYLDWQTGADTVWNTTTRSLTEFPFVVNATINNTELVFDVWSYSTRELTNAPFDPNAIANATWNYVDRELTNFTFTVDTTLNESEISTLTADQVWSYYNRSLTEGVDVNINSTVTVNTTEISGDVWSYYNRTLTDAPFDPNLISDTVWNATARYTHGVQLN